MTLIPAGTRFEGIPASTNIYLRSEQINESLTVYTMDDIAATVAADLPVDDTLVSFLKFSATEILPGFPGTAISNLVEFKNDALITVSNVQTTGLFLPGGGGIISGYSIRVSTTVPDATLYDWAIELAAVPGLAQYDLYTMPAINYNSQSLTLGIIGNVNLYGPYSTLPSGYQMDNVTVRVTAKLKP
jgi:hypothetical protein